MPWLLTTHWNTQVHSGWWSRWPKTKIAHSAMSKRWGAKSRRQICSANSTHLMEPSPCQEDYITLQKLERGSDCWKHCPQSLTKSKRSPVWRRRRNCSAYEYQSGVLLHPYHTCIAVLQCDTHQEPSLEKKKKLLCIWVPVWSIAPPISHLHCSIAVWHKSGVQSRRRHSLLHQQIGAQSGEEIVLPMSSSLVK